VLRSWYVTVPGVLVSLIVAGAVFGLVPVQYTSSGVAVLVQQKKPLAASAANPLLAGDGSLNTTALTLIEALTTGAVEQRLGVPDGGSDTYTVTNVGSSTVADGADHPFLYITARSDDAQRSADIVAGVLEQARQELSTRQSDVRVRQQNQIKLQSVVDPTTPKAVLVTRFAFSATALVLGLILTCIAAGVTYSRAGTRAQRRPNGAELLRPIPAATAPPRRAGTDRTPAAAVSTTAPPCAQAPARSNPAPPHSAAPPRCPTRTTGSAAATRAAAHGGEG
jgi:hypothetical protein